MKESVWKTLAIILLVIFILENSLIVYGYVSTKQEEREENICYYDICPDSEYANAYYSSSDKVCSCLNYDLMGNEIVTKTEYLGKR